jgi:methionyl-tRNA synthetase
MAFGYLFAVARHLRPEVSATAAECAAAWTGVSEVWHFLGLDNLFYNAVLIPAVLLAAGVPAEKQAGWIVNEFYRLDGLKFSTSRDHAIWANEFLAEEDPGVVRAFLAWDRPDHHGTDFTMAAYTAFREHFRGVVDGYEVTPKAFAAGSPLVELEVARGERALRPEFFDPSLAVRCALNALPSGDQRARRLLGHITGE